ncbi:hypothetical protein SLE2022_184030 [Rubroshorea leprosula]
MHILCVTCSTDLSKSKYVIADVGRIIQRGKLRVGCREDDTGGTGNLLRGIFRLGRPGNLASLTMTETSCSPLKPSKVNLIQTPTTNPGHKLYIHPPLDCRPELQ